MQPSTVHPWCNWGMRAGSTLVIAPHGGRRARLDPLPPRPFKVNDLHTAQLASELARQLDASFIVNDALDRNELDLNRTSQVVRGAPWLLELIESMVAA